MAKDKDNVIHIPTQANINHAFEEGRKEGDAQARATLESPPTPQQLLVICREAAKYDMKPAAREYLHKALELLADHFSGGDPSAYYSDPKKICGCAFVLGLHIHMAKSEEPG